MSRRAAGFAITTLAALFLLAHPAGAHGVGTRSDLPLDFSQFALGGATALVLSFVIVGRTWTRGRLTRAAAGRAVPAWLGAPVSGLALLRFGPATLAVVLVVLGGTTFDGLSGTEQWRDVIGARSGWDESVVNTIGLIAVVAAVAGAYLVFATLAGRITESTTDAALVFGPSLVPILFGYTVAHYFSLFVLDGQAVLRQLSDPFGRGSDWFGTADWQVDFRLVGTTTIAWIQVLAIVGGHIAAVVVAHDRALDDEQPDVATRSQYPLLAVMVLYTVLGLWLLWNA